MSYFDRILEFVDMTKEEFLEIYNLNDYEREVKIEELRQNDYNKYGDYIHLQIAYHKLLKEGK